MPIATLAFIPNLLALHQQAPQRYPFLLESAARHPHTGRHDLLLGLPGPSLVLTAAGRLEGVGGDGSSEFLTALDAWFAQETGAAPVADVPFGGGWFLYLGYELAGEIEPGLILPPVPQADFPTALAVRCRGAILIDHEHRQAMAIAEDAQGLAQLLTDLDPHLRLCATEAPLSCRLQEEPAERYLRAVDAAKRYIREGDIFQANLSRAWRGRLSGSIDPAVLYWRLRQANPGPFCGAMRWQDHAVLSTSPERLVCVTGSKIEVRPIAGTHARKLDPAADQAQREDLLMHPKERAEHVMLVDLERNDLGRICEPGSIRVDEMMVLESYAHVHHIVSNVCGRLRRGLPPGEVIRAVFPGGTITGCPKVRCMEIIAKLEGEGRGFYTGAMGYLGLDGRMDLNILIRSLHLQGDELILRTGAGIVADSVPAQELAETRAKARGLLRGLGLRDD